MSKSGWEWGRVRSDYRTRHPTCEARLYGCLGSPVDVHHIVARIDGGGDNDSNLESRCAPCHYRETSDTNSERAAQRREAKKQAKRKNHPGRKDRYE